MGASALLVGLMSIVYIANMLLGTTSISENDLLSLGIWSVISEVSIICSLVGSREPDNFFWKTAGRFLQKNRPRGITSYGFSITLSIPFGLLLFFQILELMSARTFAIRDLQFRMNAYLEVFSVIIALSFLLFGLALAWCLWIINEWQQVRKEHTHLESKLDFFSAFMARILLLLYLINAVVYIQYAVLSTAYPITLNSYIGTRMGKEAFTQFLINEFPELNAAFGLDRFYEFRNEAVLFLLAFGLAYWALPSAVVYGCSASELPTKYVQKERTRIRKEFRVFLISLVIGLASNFIQGPVPFSDRFAFSMLVSWAGVALSRFPAATAFFFSSDEYKYKSQI